MRLLILAHVPPPAHGQSFMVKRLLDVLAGEWPDLEAGEGSPGSSESGFVHLNFVFNEEIAGVGKGGWRKARAVGAYLARVVRLRYRHRLDAVYYVPTPPHSASLYRDWITVPLLRLLFRQRVILHWHALGLGEWCQQREGGQLQRLKRWITRRVFTGHGTSWVLLPWNAGDVEPFRPQRIEVIPNGIEDPYAGEWEPMVEARLRRLNDRTQARIRGEVPTLRLFFCSNLDREKGVLDALTAALRLHEEKRFRIHLDLAGGFTDRATEEAIRTGMEALNRAEGRAVYHGFVSGGNKTDLFRQADLLLFPTHYRAEAMPLILVEALSAGLPPVTTQWRAIPELLPPGYRGIAPVHDPEGLARAIRQAADFDGFADLRQYFIDHYTLERFRLRIQELLGRSVPPG